MCEITRNIAAEYTVKGGGSRTPRWRGTIEIRKIDDIGAFKYRGEQRGYDNQGTIDDMVRNTGEGFIIVDVDGQHKIFA